MVTLLKILKMSMKKKIIFLEFIWKVRKIDNNINSQI